MFISGWYCSDQKRFLSFEETVNSSETFFFSSFLIRLSLQSYLMFSNCHIFTLLFITMRSHNQCFISFMRLFASHLVDLIFYILVHFIVKL